MSEALGNSTPENSDQLGVSFVSLPGMPAVEIFDPVERHRYRLETPEESAPREIDPESFLFPVDRAIRIKTTEFGLPNVVAIYVRSEEGRLLAEAEHFAAVSLPKDRYVIEVCSPVKLYLEVESTLEISSDQNSMRIEFDDEIPVSIGARSAHERPECTLTTTEDPVDMLAVLSAFGSALKTTSPERSFPTLRGHPPTVALGDELSIPEELKRPDTGVTIQLEPSYKTIYTAGSLSYYLGASVERGTENRLVTDEGFVKPLGSGSEFDANVEQILKQIFLFDCVTRTQGLYRVELEERHQVEDRIEFDFGDLYEQPFTTRLQRYLEPSFEVVSDLVPQWGLTAHMLPTSAGIQILPYLVDDLAVVQVHEPNSIERPASPTAIADVTPIADGAFTRSSGSSVITTQDFVRPPRTDAVEQVWFGDGTPIGASKAVPAAYENRLDRTPTSSDIDVTVVCNETTMNKEEGLLNEIYGSREDISLNLQIERDVTRTELRELLTERLDFIHYIGHIDDEGFDCSDGKLDISTVNEVNVAAFLLNACESYVQGKNLIEAGSIGGIVTLSEVINESAVRMGKTLAELLNTGFPLYAALEIARRESLMGARYIVIGDGKIALNQPMSAPQLVRLQHRESSSDVQFRSFPTSRIDLGSMILPHLPSNERHSLVSRQLEWENVPNREIAEFLQLENVPVLQGDDLRWSQQLSDI